jgi:uncharacterized membrane protein YtjA (UPF0391 family)
MLRWALAFLVVALLAALFGYADIATGASWVARMLCFIFLASFVIAFTAGLVRVRKGRLFIVHHRKT